MGPMNSISASPSGIDLLFIKGWRREMIASVSGNNLRLARSDGLVLTAGDGDRVVFLDGAIDTHAWLQALAHQAPDPTPDPSLTSDGDPDTLIERVNEQAQSKASIMGYAGGNEASIFGQVQAGMQLVLKGSNLDDVVYVKPGTKVDFSESLSGVDQIVLSGSWAAYTKTMQGSGLRLQRDSEQVDVSPGDLVIFADGNAPVSAILAHLPGNPSREALGDAWQPSPTSPPLDPPPDLTAQGLDPERRQRAGQRADRHPPVLCLRRPWSEFWLGRCHRHRGHAGALERTPRHRHGPGPLLL